MTITPNDQSGHGIKEFKWCSTTNSSCEPNENPPQTTSTGAVVISTESASNRVCVIATDNTGANSTNICSDTYRLDKTAPAFQGVGNLSVTVGGSVNLTSGVSVSDFMSGMDGTYTYHPTSVSTSNPGNQTVTYEAIDFAGNQTSIGRMITVSGYQWQKYDTIINYTYYWDQYGAIANTTGLALIESSYFAYLNNSSSFTICRLYTIHDDGTASLSDCQSGYLVNILDYNLYQTYPYLQDYSGGDMFRKISSIRREADQSITMYYNIFKVQPNPTYTQGNYIGEVTSNISSSYPQNGVNGASWYVYKKSEISFYSKGSTYYGTVTSSSSSTYPTNGKHSDGYWYIRI